MIAPLNEAGQSWKSNDTDICNHNNKTGADFFEYFNKKVYSPKEIFLYYNDNDKDNDNFEEKPKHLYLSACSGLYFKFNYKISVNLSQFQSRNKVNTIELKSTLEYDVSITDTKLYIYTIASDIFPRTFFKLKPKGGIKLLFLKVIQGLPYYWTHFVFL